MRVLLADKLPDAARARLEKGGFEVRAEPGIGGDVLAAAMAEYDPHVLVVRSTKVEARHVEGGKALSLVVRAGAGYDTIDLDACSRRGVFVSNCPGKNAIAVAELTMGLFVSLDRRIPDNVADFRKGTWNKGEYSKANGLAGRTLAILGLGGIGSEVAKRALAFDLDVVGWSRSLTPEGAAQLGIRHAATPVDAARDADLLTVHLASSPDTRGIVNEAVLGALKPGALFVNTSRADIVDDAALTKALETRKLWFATDVPSGEPKGKDGPVSHPLAGHPRVYVTHHIGASTEQAQQAVAAEACRIIEDYRDAGEVDNVVNVAERTGADRVVVVRHLDRVGVLAGVLGELREAGVNVEEMANTIFAGGEGAVARIQVRGPLTDAVVDKIRRQTNVLAVEVMQLSGGR